MGLQLLEEPDCFYSNFKENEEIAGEGGEFQKVDVHEMLKQPSASSLERLLRHIPALLESSLLIKMSYIFKKPSPRLICKDEGMEQIS